MRPPGSTLCKGGSRTYQNGKPFCSVTTVAPVAADGFELLDEARPLMRFEGQAAVRRNRRAAEGRRLGLDARREIAEIARDTQAVATLMAARCAPRATTATGIRARASAAARKPPIAPAPTTAMRVIVETLEATGRFELPNGAFAEPCLTTWLRRRTRVLRSLSG